MVAKYTLLIWCPSGQASVEPMSLTNLSNYNSEEKNCEFWGVQKEVFEGFPNHSLFFCVARSNHKNLHLHALILALLDN